MSKSEFDVDRIAIENGTSTVASVVERFLGRIVADNDRLNIFTHVNPEAIEDARGIDRQIAAGQTLPLAGMVIAVKDVIAQKGKPLTCASKMLSGFTSLYTATAVQRLIDNGAVVIGRTNCDEFAMGSSNETSFYGPTRNPLDETRVPGGSSGGSAAAVAAGMCHVALGSDTGGSIRQPAAFCGVVGLKPTYGRVSRRGLVAFASSLDCLGPITASVQDAALVLQTMAGMDVDDATSADVEVADYVEAIGTSELSRLRVGVPAEFETGRLPEEIQRALAASRGQLERLGVEFDEVSLPHTEYGIATYYILATAEASSNLGRYDGIRYGHRAQRAQDDSQISDSEAFFTLNRSDGFGEEVKRRLMLGTYVLSAGYYDKYYGRAQFVRSRIRQDFESVFEKVDALLVPVTPGSAYELGEKQDDVLSMYLDDIFTVTANLAGIPGIVVPAGEGASGLPVAVQLLGNHFEESTILALASALEGINN